jgi:hypothetical protein
MQRTHRVAREEIALRPRHTQAMLDVRLSVELGQRLQVISARDALGDLPHVGAVEHVAQLRLTDQDDLQELLLGGLEVRQQPHLL